VSIRQKVVVLVGITLMGCPPLFAYLAGGEVFLRVDLVRVTFAGIQETVCNTEVSVESPVQFAWWVLQSHRERSVEESDILPSLASCEPLAGNNPGPPKPGALIEIKANYVSQMEDERMILVQVQISKSRGSEAHASNDLSMETEINRTLQFPDDAVSYLPFSAPTGLTDELRDEATYYLRLEASEVINKRHARHGRIELETDRPGASVLLDNGKVGTVAADGRFELDWVAPGYRRVTLSLETGEALSDFVKVEHSRLSLLNFNFDQARSRRKDDQISLVKEQENEFGYLEYLRPIDRARMVLIPEGEFLMGNKNTERSPFEHLVYLSSFLVDKTAVTWKQYKQFLAGTGRPMPRQDPYWGVIDNHPAVYVSWSEARGYCQWAGGRLPTEAEREKAARGTDRRLYPWGEESPTPERAVFRSSWGNEATQPVGVRPQGASPYGVMDMGGNVWEWCADWYSEEYLKMSPYENPTGPEISNWRVLRGGSWDSRPDVLSASCRNWGHPGYREGDFGFRCAMNVPPN
jgi:formylglycine-generating enzyme required for sulfatase activity